MKKHRTIDEGQVPTKVKYDYVIKNNKPLPPPTTVPEADSPRNSLSDDDVQYQCHLAERIYRQRTREQELALGKALLSKAHQLVEEITSMPNNQSPDVLLQVEEEEEQKLQNLTAKLRRHSEALQGALSDGKSSSDTEPTHESVYRMVIVESLQRQRERQRREQEEIECRAKAQERCEEIAAMTTYCRDSIVLQLIVDEGIARHEAEIERVEAMRLQQLIDDDAAKRESERKRCEEQRKRESEARERQYLHCSDPVLRVMRESAHQRHLDELARQSAADEAEIVELERRCAALALPVSSVPIPSSQTLRHQSNSRATGNPMYWKKGSEAPLSSKGSSAAPQTVRADEVSKLLEVIDVAGDSDEGVGKGLSMLLSGIQV